MEKLQMENAELALELQKEKKASCQVIGEAMTEAEHVMKKAFSLMAELKEKERELRDTSINDDQRIRDAIREEQNFSKRQMGHGKVMS
mmetsp:Transcript_21156/g.36377  ORF Transcript_21156/g.36377 Transcript_21156/m.36377 type:complete len:88 (+) Transcript_21156:1144-1407(+)